ncbi:hypothetical protein B0H12DRAFT_1153526 [Mycena haematopus]|nr:hypothetical protein B0H12DRAFT_1153526 [Mycena haematopus]
MQLLKSLAAVLAANATLPLTPSQIYNVVYTVPEGQNLVQFSGFMRVPHLPHAGYYYLWPGLFLPDYGGVLQPVLSGGTGQWSINRPAGQQDVQYVAFGVDEGDDVWFNMQKNDTWSITLSVPGTNKTSTNSFPMIGASLREGSLLAIIITYGPAAPAKADNIPYAVFEIELWGQVWDFGPLTFTNITLVSNGTSSLSSSSGSWCSDKPSSSETAFQASGATSTVSSGQVTCNIQSLVLQQPGGNATAAPNDTPAQSKSTSQRSAPFVWFSCIVLSVGMLLHDVL